jgi:hypothetical protein
MILPCITYSTFSVDNRNQAERYKRSYDPIILHPINTRTNYIFFFILDVYFSVLDVFLYILEDQIVAMEWEHPSVKSKYH